jgi:hypothetical protein
VVVHVRLVVVLSLFVLLRVVVRMGQRAVIVFMCVRGRAMVPLPEQHAFAVVVRHVVVIMAVNNGRVHVHFIVVVICVRNLLNHGIPPNKQARPSNRVSL